MAFRIKLSKQPPIPGGVKPGGDFQPMFVKVKQLIIISCKDHINTNTSYIKSQEYKHILHQIT